MKTKRKGRLTAILLSIVMCLSLIPITVFADGGSGSGNVIRTVNLTNSAPEVGKTPADMTCSADNGF